MTARRAIVLAAGKGTRMDSDLPKVLAVAGGKTLIEHVLDALARARVSLSLVVVGYQAERVKKQLGDREDVTFVIQQEQRGTGHAVQVCEAELGNFQGPVLVVAGDSPMIQPETVEQLFDYYLEYRPACIIGTLKLPNPEGLGRIVRDGQGDFQAIVEQEDATPRQQAITEVNMSTYLFDACQLRSALARLDTQNSQSEYYLTDCPGILKADGLQVAALDVLKPCEGLSVNTLEQLNEVEAVMKRMGY
jgi:bifunctional UDP-N-acetylglucosamine pyrophosphorylase/glucosamine-1-phosphate N-acetyltransferase/UDP-N-acetylglucosamine pyrophosphorylase